MLSTWPRIVIVLPGGSLARYSASDPVDVARRRCRGRGPARWRSTSNAGCTLVWLATSGVDAALDRRHVRQQLRRRRSPRRQRQGVRCASTRVELVRAASATSTRYEMPLLRIDPVVRLHLAAAGRARPARCWPRPAASGRARAARVWSTSMCSFGDVRPPGAGARPRRRGSARMPLGDLAWPSA